MFSDKNMINNYNEGKVCINSYLSLTIPEKMDHFRYIVLSNWSVYVSKLYSHNFNGNCYAIKTVIFQSSSQTRVANK